MSSRNGPGGRRPTRKVAGSRAAQRRSPGAAEQDGTPVGEGTDAQEPGAGAAEAVPKDASRGKVPGEIAPLAAADPHELDHGAATASPGVRRWRVAVAALSVVALGLVTAAVLVGLQVRRGDATDDARAKALSVARVAAETLTSYDYRRLDENLTAALAVTGPPFTQEYRDTFDKAVRELAAKNNIVVQSDVISAGVSDASPDRVEVIAFVNQNSTGTQQEAQRQAQNRLRLTMSKIDGKWLVTKLDTL